MIDPDDVANVIEGAIRAIPGAIEALGETRKMWRAWRGFRMVAFGETMVGKTTLWRHLQTGKMVEADIAPTANVEKLDKFKVRHIKVRGVSARILAVDVPGDRALRSTWRQMLADRENPPHGVIFMMDHAAGAGPLPDCGYDQQRLDQHFEAFREMRELIAGNEVVRDHLQAVLILVNKSDVWPRHLEYGHLLKASKLQELYTRFQEFDNCRVQARSCSALYGANVEEGIAWMIRNFR